MCYVNDNILLLLCIFVCLGFRWNVTDLCYCFVWSVGLLQCSADAPSNSTPYSTRIGQTIDSNCTYTGCIHICCDYSVYYCHNHHFGFHEWQWRCLASKNTTRNFDNYLLLLSIFFRKFPDKISRLALFFSLWQSPFYMYICVSQRFRHQFIHVSFKICIERWHRSRVNIIHWNKSIRCAICRSKICISWYVLLNWLNVLFHFKTKHDK